MFKVESNIEDLKSQMKNKTESFIQADKIFREACLNTIALITDRVQQKGQKTDGSQIGKYSDKTLTFKTITSKFATNANKSQYNKRMKEFGDHDEFYGGYKELRESVGLQTEYVDLTFTGDMFNDFTFAPDGETGYVVGFRGQHSSDKADWNERKYGTIFQLSESEKEFINKIVKDKINGILNK